ncbi:MAG: cyclic nucleotide-binding domain-containing protein [Candidatus Omnitrophica bacterium]|nr:cyclic nucleotide-binding domain-containing protein [Candidatus Omnitrophota bacterium]
MINTDSMKNIPVLAQLSSLILDKLSGIIQEKKYNNNEEIFAQGSPADSFIIVYSGSVTISAKSRTLAIITEKLFFGEMALFEDKPRIASATANGQAILWLITREEFLKLLNSDLNTATTLLMAIISTTLERLNKTNQAVITLYEIGKIIGEAPDLKNMSSAIFRKIAESLQACEGIIAIHNEFTEEFDIHDHIGPQPLSITTLESTDPLIELLADTKEPLLIENIETYPESDLVKDKFYYKKSLICAPFFHLNKFLGFILFIDDKVNRFDRDDFVLLSTCAGELGSAIDNARYRQEEEARSRLNHNRI